jgi:serine/threonine protein kinase
MLKSAEILDVMSPLPTRISRYEIKGLIAQGGMGDLYLARDPNTSRFVALKLLNATLDSSELRGRFEREGRALASLNHPGIVHIYDYGDFQGAPFIVMEYVRGETLAEKIKRKAPISIVQKLKLMTELCSGLAHAHHAGIIHRDIKPANLMVDQDGRLKILDFGIARVADSNLTRFGSALTIVNMRIGTPGYMSPEQIQGGEVDHRADIFSVGAVCYELLSYREAFSGVSAREIERNVMQAEPAPLPPFLPALDPEIGAIVSRALAKDRNNRFQNVAQLGEALESYRAKLQPSETPPSYSEPMRQSPGGGSGSRGEAAYQRALAVYQDGARETARRFAIEALAEDPDHQGARALLARLEPERKAQAAPRPLWPASTVPPTALRTSAPAAPEPKPDPPTDLAGPNDPTVFIPRANRPAAPTHTEETVFIPRTNRPPAPTRTDEVVFIPRKEQPARVPPKDPIGPSSRTKPPASSFRKRSEHIWSFFPPLWTRWTGRLKGGQTPRKSLEPVRAQAGASWYSGREVQIVAALLIVLGATVVLVIGITKWISPSGQLLTITKPVGGTIVSAGITCGTRGSDCSTTLATGDPVELATDADDGFAFGGFTGDCAPTGRTAMTAPRTCGATFNRVTDTATAATWPLTITPPVGGTVLAAGDIQCGSLGSACSATLPVGVPVTLYVKPDAGYTFLTFTGDCAPSGNTLMTGSRTCSATFAPSVAGSTSKPVAAPPRPTRPPPLVVDSPPTRAGPPPPGPADPDQTARVESPTKVVPGKDAKDTITPEEHSRKEIPEVMKEYCAALEALDPLQVQKVHPSADLRALREQFRQYRSNKCTLAGEPKFVQLDADAGTAKIEVGMKQILEMRSGGAPRISETIAETTLSRPALRTAWRIATVKHRAKPKE